MKHPTLREWMEQAPTELRPGDVWVKDGKEATVVEFTAGSYVLVRDHKIVLAHIFNAPSLLACGWRPKTPTRRELVDGMVILHVSLLFAAIYRNGEWRGTDGKIFDGPFAKSWHVIYDPTEAQ